VEKEKIFEGSHYRISEIDLLQAKVSLVTGQGVLLKLVDTP
jgi:hypothetical protein